MKGLGGRCIFTRTQRAGFTLIELVVVIAAMGAFVVSLIPKESFSRFNLETAVVKVESDLRYAQELATVSNTNCGIQFVASGSYTVYQQTVGTPVSNPLTLQSFVANLSQDFKNVHFVSNIQVEFDPLGKPVLGGGQTVQITNGQTTASLLVISNTGVIQRQ